MIIIEYFIEFTDVSNLLILQILLIYWLCTRPIHSYVEAQELIGWYYRFAYGDELITYKL